MQIIIAVQGNCSAVHLDGPALIGKADREGRTIGTPGFAEDSPVVERCIASAEGVVDDLIALRLPEALVLDMRTVAASQGAACPGDRAPVGDLTGR